MKIYRVRYHTGNVGDSGIAVTWLPSKAEVRRFVEAVLRGDGEVSKEEYEGDDGTWVLPFNLNNLYYHQGLDSGGVFKRGWVVEEVDVPTKSKIDMIDFLNLVADSE